jgi:hypothetical protein
MVRMPSGPGVQRDASVLEGVLERVTFANPETGYTIARLDSGRGAQDLITAVGPLLGAQVGESLRMRGRLRLRGHHPPVPGQRVPCGGHPAHHGILDDAPAEPSLHRRDPGEETRRAGRLTASPWR